MVMHLACINLHMSMPEALAAATINAAAALGLSEDYGSLEEGKWADMIIVNANK
jgi:imidazolonepropionase